MTYACPRRKGKKEKRAWEIKMGGASEGVEECRRASVWGDETSFRGRVLPCQREGKAGGEFALAFLAHDT
jgi:hypothetical protein